MSIPISALPPAQNRPNKPTISQRLGKVGFALVVILICAITFFPIYWMLVTTIQPTKLTLHFPPSLLPQAFDLSSYREVFDKQPVGRWILNSIILSTITTVICVVLAIFGGYALSALRWRGRGLFADLPAHDTDAAGSVDHRAGVQALR